MDREATERTAAEWHELSSEVQHIVTDQAVRAWRYHSLLRAGFPSDLIRKELHRVTREPVPEVDDSSEPT